MTDPRMKRMILTSASEDYCGLWEAIWELNSAYPRLSPGEREFAAKAIVRELLEEGLIDLYVRKEPKAQEERLSREQWDGALSNELYWDAPEGHAAVVVFCTTPKGELACRSGLPT
jgi:hypothetical protein